jgi:hypothetical protein
LPGRMTIIGESVYKAYLPFANVLYNSNSNYAPERRGPDPILIIYVFFSVHQEMMWHDE